MANTNSLYLKVSAYIFFSGRLENRNAFKFLSHICSSLSSPRPNLPRTHQKKPEREKKHFQKVLKEKKKKKRAETMLLGHPCVKLGEEDGETKDAEEQ